MIHERKDIAMQEVKVMNEKAGVLEAKLAEAKRTLDGYTNIPANLGVGAKNLAQTGSYVLERFTWDYITLQTLFRNNWIAKAIIEKPANEMMKNGFTINTQLEPSKISDVIKTWTSTRTKDKFLDCLKWSRLFGGCLLIPMIEGQDNLEEELDYDSIGVDDYKGCFTIDRWCGVSPSLETVSDIGDPEFGQPEFYEVTDPSSNNSFKIHHSRVIKMIGRQLPYWESVAECYWGASELEHVFTELKKRDDTSANISFLIFLANIRIFKMADLGQLITLGDQDSAQKVYDTMRNLNNLMCNTGTLAVDAEDDFTMQGYTFTGINDIYESFMLDISGAAEIPIDKLFGRTPNGFSSGEETLQNYYDMIQEKQETYIREPLEKLLKIIMMSTLGQIPDDFELTFNPIRRPSDEEKADLCQKQAQLLYDGYSAGIISKAMVLRELKAQSTITGMFTNITDEMIEKAEKEETQEAEEENDIKAQLRQAANEEEPDKEELEEVPQN